MANLVFDFLHNYKTGERRESDPADAYQYDEGHVFEAVVPVAVTSCEIHYWARGFDEAEAYTPASITQNTDNSYTITGNIPNKFFETYGDLRVYIVVTDGDASITTYEGRIHICERSKPDDYVDDDPDNEATRVLVEAQEAAATATQKAADAATSAGQAAESARTLTLDTTLTQSGQAADAKAAGDAINDLKEDFSDVDDRVTALEQGGSGSGLTEDIKAALLQMARKVAYIDDQGQTYYDDLYDALYAVTAIRLDAQSIMLTSIGSTQQLTATTTPAGGTVTWASSDTSIATVSNTGLVTSVGYGSCTITASSGSVSATCSVSVAQATLTSISATYTQGGSVYPTTSLDSLKTDLVVTAHYDNSTTSVVPSADYTLSGTLSVGTSTVTVAYSGKTTTFSVTVSEAPPAWEDGVPYDGSAYSPATPNMYIKANGAEESYNGWSITNYVDCEGATALSISASAGINLTYTGFYNDNKEYVRNMDYLKNNNIIVVPSNVTYFKLSAETTKMNEFISGTKTITPMKFEPLDISTGVASDKYIDSTGAEKNYSDWSATDFIDVSNYSYIRIYTDSELTDSVNPTFCWWYDENESPLVKIDFGVATIGAGDTSKIIPITSGATSFRLSGLSDNIPDHVYVEAW